MEGVPNPRVILLPETRLTSRKSKARPERQATRRATIDLTPVGPATPQETWVERFERDHRGGHALVKPLINQEATVPTGTIIAMPRRQREGSITDEQLKAIHEAVNALTKPREAVVVCEGMDSENSARNKARSAALLHEETYETIPDPAWTADPDAKDADGNSIPVDDQEAPRVVNPRRYLTAHAVADPSNKDKFIGAVTVRTPQAPTAKPAAETPKPAAEEGTKPAPKAKPAAARS